MEGGFCGGWCLVRVVEVDTLVHVFVEVCVCVEYTYGYGI